MSLGDDEHSVRPKTATTDENIKVHQMVLDDRRIKVREIAEGRGYEHVKRTCWSYIK